MVFESCIQIFLNEVLDENTRYGERKNVQNKCLTSVTKNHNIYIKTENTFRLLNRNVKLIKSREYFDLFSLQRNYAQAK